MQRISSGLMLMSVSARAREIAMCCKSQAVYEITVEGHLDRHYWVAWFDGLTVTLLTDGTTRLSGPVSDQAALHGLLGKVRNLGLTLIAVRRVTLPGHSGD
jgi:hypothetical protein